MSGRQLGACQFFDDDQLCSLETAIVQLGARECVVPQPPATPGANTGTLGAGGTPEGGSTLGTAGGGGTGAGVVSADWRRLHDVLSRCGVMATERPKAMFSAKHLESDVAKLLKVWGVRCGMRVKG